MPVYDVVTLSIHFGMQHRASTHPHVCMLNTQAMDRAHRIGQKKEVQVFRFCTEMSIEEKVRTQKLAMPCCSGACDTWLCL